MLPLATLRLPSLSAVITAMEKAIHSVCSACTFIKNSLAQFLFGSDRLPSSVAVLTSTAASSTPRVPTIPAAPLSMLAVPVLVVATPTAFVAAVAAPSLASSRDGLVPLEPFVAESNRMEIVFGPGDRFYRESEYEMRLLDAAIRLPAVDSFMPDDLGEHESYLVRPHRLLTQVLNRMSYNPELTPVEPRDPATLCCGCGSCEHGVAATRACRFLTTHRTQMRFRRRATESVAGSAIRHWHQTVCSTRPIFGRSRR